MDEQYEYGDEPDGRHNGGALEGELLIYRQHPYEARGKRERFTAPGQNFGPRAYDESFVREVIDYSITHPHQTLRDIGLRFGISHETVSRWARQRTEERRASVDIVALRTEAAMQLEAARNEAWKVYDRAATSGNAQVMKLALDALRTVGGLTSEHARLMGLNMPVKVDVQVTAVTQAEMELQELIREAQARAYAAEADVIAQASTDPDL